MYIQIKNLVHKGLLFILILEMIIMFILNSIFKGNNSTTTNTCEGKNNNFQLTSFIKDLWRLHLCLINTVNPHLFGHPRSQVDCSDNCISG